MRSWACGNCFFITYGIGYICCSTRHLFSPRFSENRSKWLQSWMSRDQIGTLKMLSTPMGLCKRKQSNASEVSQTGIFNSGLVEGGSLVFLNVFWNKLTPLRPWLRSYRFYLFKYPKKGIINCPNFFSQSNFQQFEISLKENLWQTSMVLWSLIKIHVLSPQFSK